MKKNKILIATAFVGLAFASCTDLDTAPDSNIVTEQQKGETLAANPDMAAAGVNGIYALMKAYMPNATALGAERHNDIGYPSIMLFTDANGFDVISDANGYNWCGNSIDLYDHSNYTSREVQMVWNNLYAHINTCNSVIKTIDVETEDPTLQFYAAQGLANRAFNYFMLAQLFQFNVQQNADKPCVPIITDENADEAAANGCARSSVKDVYAQIVKDIDLAVSLLEKSDVERSDHRYVSAAVAYGLRARINLTMGKWAEAASDAKKAIELSAEEGVNPLSMDAAKKPGFYDAKDWMWGIIVDETDRIVTSGIVNWISHMGSLNYGYGSYAGGRQINKKLFAEISNTDVRKGWWTNEDGVSANLTKDQQAYIDDNGFVPFTQVKFGPDQDVLDQDVNANDIIMMRVEEMYLILAEAQAMAGNPAEGAKTLENFVKTYRDAEYVCLASTKEAVQNAVWMQRRIELWGEGLSWYDIMRLGKDIDRRGSGYAEDLVFNIKFGDDIYLWRIPQAEIQANKLISEEDNNPAAAQPKPVADTE